MKVYLFGTDLNKGSPCFEGCESVTEGQLYSPSQLKGNVSDHDLFIFDLEQMRDTGSGLFLNLNNDQKFVFDRITAGGILICFLGTIKADPHSRYCNYTWLKDFLDKFIIRDLNGKDLKFVNTDPEVLRFANLLSAYPGTWYFSAVFDRKNDSEFKTLAANKADIAVGFYRPMGKGHVFLLPRPIEQEEFVEFFLSKVLPAINPPFDISRFACEQEPEFVNEIVIPGTPSLQKSIDEEKKQVAQLEQAINENLKKLNQLNEWKSLLWQTDIRLELVVKKFFALLSLNLEKQEIDLVGELNGKEVFIEVKGKTGGIDHKKDFRQISERKMFNSKDPANTFALLVGNPYRKLPVAERPPNKEFLFAPSSVPLAEKNGIGLVSTMEIFKGLNDLLNNEESFDRVKFLEDILNTNGIYTYAGLSSYVTDTKEVDQ